MAKKSTNYEIIRRVKLVIDLILDGLSRYEIVQYGSEKWKITNRQVDDYIAYATKRIDRMAEKAEQKAFNRIRVRLERQYRRSIQKDDGRLTIIILDRMCRLYGLDQPSKIELGGNVGLHPVQDRLEDLTDAQLIGLSGVGIKPQMKLIKKPTKKQ